MKRFLSFACSSLLVFTFGIASASVAFSADAGKKLELNSATAEQLTGTGLPADLAKKIVELRDQLGSFQSYDDLNDLNLTKEQLDKLRGATSLQGISSECNC